MYIPEKFLAISPHLEGFYLSTRETNKISSDSVQAFFLLDLVGYEFFKIIYI